MISVEARLFLVDLYGLPDLAGAVFRLTSEDPDIFETDAVACGFGVLQDCGFFVRFRMFIETFAEFPLSFPSIFRFTVIAGNVIYCATFVSFVGFVFGVHQYEPDGVKWFVVNIYPMGFVNAL